MNLELTDEQLALRATVRRFVTEKASVAGYVRSMLNDPTGKSDLVWDGLATVGATGLLVPTEYGGTGMTMVEAGIVAEELGSLLHPGPWLSCAVAVPRILMRTGAAGSAGELLTGIADGSLIATVGPFTGPRPTAAEDAGRIVLNGQLAGISDLAAADVALILADGPHGTGLYAVQASSHGLTWTIQNGIDQTRKWFGVTLAEVPAKRLAAAPADVVQAVIDDVIVAYAADALGAATAVMRVGVEHAKARRQFGQPIGSFQAIQHLCADMYETVELARGGVIHALWAADTADCVAAHLAAVRAKAFAAQLVTVADTAIQVLGGIGYTWEHDAQLYLRRLLAWTAFLGGAGRYLEELGAELVRSVSR